MSSYATLRFAIYSLLAVMVNMSIFSVPVFAASEGFSFVEFSLAFVLGLSLPILLMVFLIKPLPAMIKRIPLLMTLALLGLFYSLIYPTQNATILSLFFCCLLLQASCYWLINLHKKDEDLNIKPLVKNIAFAVSLGLFIVLLWSDAVNEKVTWLLFSFLQLALVAGYVWRMRNSDKSIHIRSVSLLVLNAIFATCIYVWLALDISINTIVVISVITHLLTMANGCWHLGTTLSTGKNAPTQRLRQAVIRESYDPATNLPNYQFALSFFEHSIKKNLSARYAVIVFKPTNFQQVNNVLGHHNSDILLLQLAYCLQKSIAADDELLNFSSKEAPVRLARLQGLHFLVVMDMSQSTHSDELVIEQVCKQLALAVPGPMSFKSFSSSFNLVFGVAFVGQDSNNVSEVIACAEDALLQAEQQKQLVGYFSRELATYNQKQLQKMEQLKHAINHDVLQWRLHPQVALESKIIIGFELEVVWQRQEDELLNLAEMMTIAEQSGDDYALSRQMVRQAFDFLVELQRLNVPVQLAIKLTGESLLEPDLIDYIEQQSAVHKIDCQLLLVEIKEEILLMDSPQAKASIDQLRSLGVEIVIDEFSGSYQALRYVRKLAVSGIKIDCSTLAKATAGSADKAIINALITLTRKMDLPLIGSHIDGQVIEEMYLAIGGEYGQGQLYSAGISLEELPHWLDAWDTHYAQNA
ncbi:MAG: EAL domain-containing protein [Cognaticolwellia sp.]